MYFECTFITSATSELWSVDWIQPHSEQHREFHCAAISLGACAAQRCPGQLRLPRKLGARPAGAMDNGPTSQSVSLSSTSGTAMELSALARMEMAFPVHSGPQLED